MPRKAGLSSSDVGLVRASYVRFSDRDAITNILACVTIEGGAHPARRPAHGADWVELDPLETLSSTIDAIRRWTCRLPRCRARRSRRPGPIASTATPGGAGRLGAPIHAAMGNHDDRETPSPPLRARPGLTRRCAMRPSSERSLDCARHDDSGEDAGLPRRGRLTWLEDELRGVSPRTSTVLAMHHPPLLTGSAAFDRFALTATHASRWQSCEPPPAGASDCGCASTQTAAYGVRLPPGVGCAEHLRAVPAGPGRGQARRRRWPPGFIMHMIGEDGSLLSVFETVPRPRPTT